MDIFKIISFAFVALFMIIIIRQDKPNYALFISLVASVLILIFLLPNITMIIKLIKDFTFKSQLDFIYIDVVFKVIGISFLATLCSEICRDAGENALAKHVELAGKVLILILSIPILTAVFESILEIMQVSL